MSDDIRFVGEVQDVDKWLAELWFIGDLISKDLNTQLDVMQREVDAWEPKPMPMSWHPSRGRRFR